MGAAVAGAADVAARCGPGLERSWSPQVTAVAAAAAPEPPSAAPLALFRGRRVRWVVGCFTNERKKSISKDGPADSVARRWHDRGTSSPASVAICAKAAVCLLAGPTMEFYVLHSSELHPQQSSVVVSAFFRRLCENFSTSSSLAAARAHVHFSDELSPTPTQRRTATLLPPLSAVSLVVAFGLASLPSKFPCIFL